MVAATTTTAAFVAPRPRRLTPDERVERRRKQHRELVARGRARVRESLVRLRNEETVLRGQVVSLVEDSPGVADARSDAPLRVRCVAAIAQQLELEKQNARLEEQLERHVRLRDAIVAEARTLDTPRASIEQFLADLRREHQAERNNRQGREALEQHPCWRFPGPRFWRVVPRTGDDEVHDG